jgi:hypothetical protein
MSLQAVQGSRLAVNRVEKNMLERKIRWLLRSSAFVLWIPLPVHPCGRTELGQRRLTYKLMTYYVPPHLYTLTKFVIQISFFRSWDERHSEEIDNARMVEITDRRVGDSVIDRILRGDFESEEDITEQVRKWIAPAPTSAPALAPAPAPAPAEASVDAVTL